MVRFGSAYEVLAAHERVGNGGAAAGQQRRGEEQEVPSGELGCLVNPGAQRPQVVLAGQDGGWGFEGGAVAAGDQQDVRGVVLQGPDSAQGLHDAAALSMEVAGGALAAHATARERAVGR